MVRQLADTEQTSLTAAIGLAVRHELERKGIVPLTEDEVERRMDAIRQLQERVRRAPIDWSLSEDEILGYDEFGVPEQPYLNDRG